MKLASATLPILAVLGLALSAGVVPAGAAGPSISLSPSSGPPGTSVTVSGTGFCTAGCSAVSVDVNGDPISQGVTVSSSGTFQVTVAMSGGTGSGSLPVLASQQAGASPPQTMQALTYFALTPNLPSPGQTSPTFAPPVTTIVPPIGTPSASSTTTTVPKTTTTGPKNGAPGPAGGNGSSTTEPTTHSSTGSADAHDPGSSAQGWSSLSLALVALVAAAVLGIGGFVAYRRFRGRQA